MRGGLGWRFSLVRGLPAIAFSALGSFGRRTFSPLEFVGVFEWERVTESTNGSLSMDSVVKMLRCAYRHQQSRRRLGGCRGGRCFVMADLAGFPRKPFA